jgi:DNA-binding MarR family transcriptional regulator
MGVDLADEVADAIAAISSQLRLRFAAAGRKNELGFVALATLRHLVRHGPKAVSDLAASDRVTTQAVSLRVAPLVAAGLVLREADEMDARRAILTPTADGKKVVGDAVAKADAAFRSAVDALAPGDRRALQAALPALEHLRQSLVTAELPE